MSDDATPRLGLPYVAAGQAQKHVTVNEAMARLDGLVQTAAVSRAVAVQPAAPEDGALYILPEGATGAAWSGAPAGTLMRFEAGGWSTLPTRRGHIAWILDEDMLVVFRDGWRPLAEYVYADTMILARSPCGAQTRALIREEDVTLTGAAVISSIVIPARSLVLSVGSRTLTAVTGATAYNCGVPGEPAKFGGSLGAAAGSTNSGVIGPTAVYSDTPIALTAVGPAFTGGVVRLSVHILQFDLPNA